MGANPLRQPSVASAALTVAFRLQQSSHSALAVLLRGAIGSPWPAWHAVGSGALAIEDPNEVVGGVPLLGLLQSNDVAWVGLGSLSRPVTEWSGEPLPLSSNGPWPSVPQFPPLHHDRTLARATAQFSPAEAMFAALLAAGADPWVSWKSVDSCDGECDAFDVAMSWGSAALVEACLRHPSRPALEDLHKRSAWRSLNRTERAQSAAHKGWLKEVDTLTQLSAMCGHDKVLAVLLENDFPLVRNEGERHPLAVAQNVEVCRVLLAHGVRVKDATYRSKASLKSQWEMLSKASVPHARTLDERKDALEVQLMQVESSRTPADWAKHAVLSFRRGFLEEMRKGLANAAPDLAEKIDSNDENVSQRGMAQALLRFANGSSPKQCMVGRFADYSLSLSLSKGSAKTERLKVAMGILAWAAQEQYDARVANAPLPEPGYSIFLLGQLVWAAHSAKKSSGQSSVLLGVDAIDRHWDINGMDVKAALPVLLRVANELSQAKREWMMEGWERALMARYSGRSSMEKQGVFRVLEPYQSEINQLGLGLGMLATDFFLPMISDLSLPQRVKWYGALQRQLTGGNRLTQVVEKDRQALAEQPVPWPEDLAEAVKQFMALSLPQTLKSHEWRLSYGSWERLSRVHELAQRLPEPSSTVPRGPRF